MTVSTAPMKVWSISSENGSMPCRSENSPMTVSASKARAIVEPSEKATLRKRTKM